MNFHASKTGEESRAALEGRILKAIRELRFGNVEIIVHESRVTEIRQTRRIRPLGEESSQFSTDPNPGGIDSNGQVA